MKHPNTIQPKSELSACCGYPSDKDVFSGKPLCYLCRSPFHPRESSGEEGIADVVTCECDNTSILDRMKGKEPILCKFHADEASTDTEWMKNVQLDIEEIVYRRWKEGDEVGLAVEIRVAMISAIAEARKEGYAEGEIMEVKMRGEVWEQAKQSVLSEILAEITTLLKQFANTPLDKRENGWEWLLKLKTIIMNKMSK